MRASQLLSTSENAGKFTKSINNLFVQFSKLYGVILYFCLKVRYIIVILATLIFIASLYLSNYAIPHFWHTTVEKASIKK